MRPSTKPPEGRPQYPVEWIRDAGSVVTRLQQEFVPLVLRGAIPDMEVENRTEVVSRDDPDDGERLS